MVDNEMYRETVGPFPNVSIEDARNRAREIRREIQGRESDVPGLTVSEALDRYSRERQARRKLAARSIRSQSSYYYKLLMKQHLNADMEETTVCVKSAIQIMQRIRLSSNLPPTEEPNTL